MYHHHHLQWLATTTNVSRLLSPHLYYNPTPLLLPHTGAEVTCCDICGVRVRSVDVEAHLLFHQQGEWSGMMESDSISPYSP